MLPESSEFSVFNMFTLESNNTLLKQENEALQRQIHA